MTATSEIQKLIQINHSVLNQETHFRDRDVFCGTRDQRKVMFVPSNLIEEFLTKTFTRFLDIYNNSETIDEISFAMAYIWLGLISIHPFPDGNGRTAKRYMSEKLNEKGYELKSTLELDSFLLDDNTTENLSALLKIFQKNISKI